MDDRDAIEVIEQLAQERRLIVPRWPALVAAYSQADTPSGFRAQMQNPKHLPPPTPFAVASIGALQDLKHGPPLFRFLVSDGASMRGVDLNEARRFVAAWSQPAEASIGPRKRPSELAN